MIGFCAQAHHDAWLRASSALTYAKRTGEQPAVTSDGNGPYLVLDVMLSLEMFVVAARSQGMFRPGQGDPRSSAA